ncbi:hypothetical protein AGOR_G00220680 [Albula goreensis]|uniref:Probable ATP-dependent RNA helicase DDX47 n=1 Tax=Albula goreensis TaxID=1534307 RepID=A0A8T3CL83_9TELE|nr:hypothetical protein AGOR_G00220680 [Albula goreensis]
MRFVVISHTLVEASMADEQCRSDGDDKINSEIAFEGDSGVENVEESEKETPKTFKELGVTEVLCEACEQLGWKSPTKIQVEAIPVALQGRDVIGLAETGSGKTGAFALPILQSLLSSAQRLHSLVLTPTRELAFQIAEQFDALGSSIGVKTAVIVGGIDMMSQSLALAKKPHIVIATPGRLIDHLENTKGFTLRALRFLVMDEADRILNMDFETEVDKILKVIPRERHTFLFSATMTKKVQKLQRAALKDPVKCAVSTKYSTVDKLQQYYIFIPSKYKDCYLVSILNELAGNSFMIFCSTCNNAQRVALLLRNLGITAIPLHGQMSQNKRLGALNKFKSKSRSVLLATDVASRGLDIPHVDCVINYDIPTHSKDYIHRVGRTARAGRSGKSITFVTQYDVELFQRIETLIGKKLPAFPTQEEEVMMLVERVSEAQRFARIEMKEQGEQHKKRGREGDGDDTEQSSGVRKKLYRVRASSGLKCAPEIRALCGRREGGEEFNIKFHKRPTKRERGTSADQVMDFLIGSPFATPVGQRIEQATSSSLQSEDWGLNMEICDIINETEEGPKDAVRAIKKRIVGNKNFREVMLALTVLEACVKNCGHRFHVLVSTRQFIEGVLVRAILPKNNPPMVLQDRVLSLIQAWADAFRSSPSLTGVVSVYEDLRRRGLEFPMATDTISPIHTPHQTSRSGITVSEATPNAAPSNQEAALTISPDQVEKLRADLEVVRGNLTVMSEMISQLQPGGAPQSDTELLQQLYTVCKCMQDRVVELIPRLADESLIEELLAVNDEFNTTFTTYHRFEEQCSEQETTEQSAGSSTANLIDLSSPSPTKNQSVFPAEPAHQPVSQSAVSTLSSQMAELSADYEFDKLAQSRSRSLNQQSMPVEAQSGGEGRQQSRGADESPDSTPLGSSPHSDWMIAKGMIPVHQSGAMDDIEKWLNIDGEEELEDTEGVTSEEFDKFLELRAKAADRLPSLRASPPTSASLQPQDQSSDQIYKL